MSSQGRLLRIVHKALKSALSHLKPSRKIISTPLWAMKSFTDNIVLGWPVLDDAEVELGNVFYRSAYFQAALIKAGFFCRGAITVGPLYMDGSIVFGSALLDAYEAEVNLARDPRIILTPAAEKYVLSHVQYYSDPRESPQDAYLSRDADGLPFVDYLKIIYEEEGPRPLAAILKQHKHHIEERLRTHEREPRIWSKYLWCGRYHNHTCARFHSHTAGLAIDAALFDPPPRSILD
jgi:hypothetical protein